jgi:hypothetical protein
MNERSGPGMTIVSPAGCGASAAGEAARMRLHGQRKKKADATMAVVLRESFIIEYLSRIFSLVEPVTKYGITCAP